MNRLKHDNTNTSHLRLVGQVLLVNTTGNRCSPVIVEIEVQLAITSTKLKLLQEEGVIMRGQGIENIEVGLRLKISTGKGNETRKHTFLAQIKASFINS